MESRYAFCERKRSPWLSSSTAVAFSDGGGTRCGAVLSTGAGSWPSSGRPNTRSNKLISKALKRPIPVPSRLLLPAAHGLFGVLTAGFLSLLSFLLSVLEPPNTWPQKPRFLFLSASPTDAALGGTAGCPVAWTVPIG